MANAWAVLCAKGLEKYGVQMEWPALVALCERVLDMWTAGYEAEEIQKECGLFGGLALEGFQNAAARGYDPRLQPVPQTKQSGSQP